MKSILEITQNFVIINIEQYIPYYQGKFRGKGKEKRKRGEGFGQGQPKEIVKGASSGGNYRGGETL